MNANDSRATQLLTLGIGALILIFGGVLLWQHPERAYHLLLAMAVLPAGWALQRVLARSRSANTTSNVASSLQNATDLAPSETQATGERSALANSMIGAGLILLLSMLAVLAETSAWWHFEPGELRSRCWGLIIAALLVLNANVIPKFAGPPQLQSALRFVGWTLVLTGLVYALIWLVAPISLAAPFAKTAILFGASLVVIRISYYYTRPPSSASS